MADEKRRLIYELIVEAVGAEKAKVATDGIDLSLRNIITRAKGLAAPLAAAFAIKNIQQAIDDMTRFNQQLAGLGVSSHDAAEALANVQTIALSTGQAMSGVSQAYQEAIQLQQALGSSTASANDVAQSFVAIAAAEGKTAAQAAQQIQTLSFALQAGEIPAKQFVQLLKESNTFQTAAQDALGKTTAQLVEMAKAGEIGNEQLVLIVQRMEEIGRQTQAAETTQTLTEKIKTLFTIFSQGLGGQGAVDTERKKLGAVDPDAISTWEKLGDNVRATGQEFYGLGVAAKNGLDLVGDEAYLFFKSLANYDEPQKAWDAYHKAQMEDIAELSDAWATAKKGFFTGGYDDPRYSDEALAKRKADRLFEQQKERNLAALRDIARVRKEENEKIAKWEAEQAEKKRQADLKAAEDAKRARERAEADRQRDLTQLATERENRVEQLQRQQMRDAKKDIRDVGPDLQQTLDETASKSIPNLRESYLDSFEQMQDVTDTLASSLADLFSGGIENARDFFRTIASGLGRIFAQLAAQKGAELLTGLLRSATLKPGGGLSGASGGLSADDLRGYWAANGAAFSRGRVIPMAAGGVVSGPTAFPMVGGMGLMGEAGPEAVMPLKRTSSGKLGVTGSMPSITIVNRLGVAATGRVERHGDRMTLVMEAAQLGATLAESRIGRSLRSGYGDTARTIQSTYGLRRRTT